MATKKNHAAFKLMAIISFAALLAGCKPPGPKALFDGKRMLEKGRTAEAIERLRVATDLLRTNAQAWNYLGVAYHQAGQTLNASNAYRRALVISPDLMEAHLNLGTLYSEQGRPGEAKSEFNTYTLSRPNISDGFQRLAEVEFQLRELPQAELHVKRALQLDDGNAQSLNTLGMIQLQKGRPRDASQSFTAAIKKRTVYPAALLNLAIVNQQLGDRPAALKLYRQYVGQNPRPADADSVMEVIRQLEAELTPVQSPPPAAPLTPAPPTPVAPTVTQLVAVKSTPTIPVIPKPAPAPIVRSEPVVAKPVVALPPTVRPVPTVVSLPPEPIIKTTPTTESPTAVSQPKEPPKSVETVFVNLPPAPAAPKAEKHGFFQSINPAHLFRSSKQTVTPLPASPVPKQLEPAVSRPVAATPEEIAESSRSVTDPLTPVTSSSGSFPRYAYLGAGNTTSGDRPNAQGYAAKGTDAMATKRYLEAATAFRSAAEADPSWFQAHLNHSAAALQGGRVMESLHAGETALALKPDSAEARYNFALALKRGNYIVDAAIELERLLILSPDNAEAHLLLANIYAEQLHQPDKARPHYLKFLELKPGHSQSTAVRFWLRANP